MRQSTDGSVSGLLGAFEEKLKTFGHDERNYQLTVKLKPKCKTTIERMLKLLEAQAAMHRGSNQEGGEDSASNSAKSVTKAEAVEYLFDLAEGLLGVYEAQMREAKE